VRNGLITRGNWPATLTQQIVTGLICLSKRPNVGRPDSKTDN
jgi:hypothetical protein